MPVSSSSRRAVAQPGTHSAGPSAAPGPPSLPGSLSHRGPVAALESDLPVPTLAPLLDPEEARFREMAISSQEAQSGFAELLSRVSLLEERFGFVEMELAHSRESERKANCSTKTKSFFKDTDKDPLYPTCPSRHVFNQILHNSGMVVTLIGTQMDDGILTKPCFKATLRPCGDSFI